MNQFKAVLQCENCACEWEDVIENSTDCTTAEMIEVMSALWQASGCPECGWSELTLKHEFACAYAFFDGIRGDEDSDEEEVILKRSDLEYLLEQAGIDFDENEEGEIEF